MGEPWDPLDARLDQLRRAVAMAQAECREARDQARRRAGRAAGWRKLATRCRQQLERLFARVRRWPGGYRSPDRRPSPPRRSLWPFRRR